MGGIPVNPGDIIVGDADGLVAVPQEHAEAILASAKAILAKEEGSMKQIRAGTVDRSWSTRRSRRKATRSSDGTPCEHFQARAQGGQDPDRPVVQSLPHTRRARRRSGFD